MESITQNKSQSLAVLAGVGLVAITALQFTAARFSLREDLTAADIVILRFGGAAIAFLPIFWRTGWGKLKALGMRRAIALAMLAGLPYPLIINQGLSLAPASHAAALCPASIVLFTFLISRFVLGERAKTATVLGIGAVVAGLVLFVLPLSGMPQDTLMGDLLFVGSGALFALYGVLVRKWMVPPVTATGAVVLLSCLPLPLVHFFAPSGLGMASGAEIAAQIVIQGFLAGAAAIVLFSFAATRLGPQTASLFLPWTPIATAAIGVVFLGEIPNAQQFLGIVFLMGGMLLPHVGGVVKRPMFGS